MKLCGLQKTTLLDFPGKVAATIFTGGCSFACPFCHNSELLGRNTEALCSQEEVMTFLEKRKNILEGVCITGGEPTLQPDLEDFIQFVRSLGLAVKLDTNGYQPNVLINLCEKGLLDYVAMDIKAGKSHYAHVSGRTGLNLERIDQSIRFLLNGSVPFEFRTTVVKSLHDKSDFEEIGPWIQGCGQYFLQSYQESGQVLSPDSCKSFPGKKWRNLPGLYHPMPESSGSVESTDPCMACQSVFSILTSAYQ